MRPAGETGPAGDGQGVAARRAAVQALQRVVDDEAWASPVVDQVLARVELDARDRRFAANLVFSTLRWEGTLDWVLGHALRRPLAEIEPTLQVLLRMATWELLHGAAPDRAVLHAAVEVARAEVGQRATGFVNGVLRGVTRALPGLEWPEETTDEGLGLALGYPAWIVAAARRRFPAERLRAVLDAGNTPAPLVLRAVAPREAVLQRLADAGIDAAPGTLSNDAVVLAERADPGRLDVIAEGLAVVQDQASQVVARVAAEGLPHGAVAVDLCAAPGGKATHLAQLGLAVTAVDRHAGRLRRAAEMADRLGLQMTTRVADGRTSGLPVGAADLVLVDAPCSGLGVVRRRPELRWRRDPGDVAALATIQRGLLRAGIDLARPGGRVAYAVCTWTQEETDDVVDDVLGVGVTTEPGPDVGTRTRRGVQISPDVDAGDGMYLAVLRKDAEAGS